MRITILLFLIITSINSHAQTNSSKVIDSLEQIVVSKVHDTVRIKSLLELANQYHDIDLNVAIKKANEAYKILQKTNYPKGINLYYVIKCRENIYLNNNKLSIYYAQQAQKSSLKTNDIDKYIYGCLYESIVYCNLNENKKTIAILNRALNYLKDKKETDVKGDLYITLASAYSRELKNNMAISTLKKAVSFCRKRNDVLGVHNCYFEMCQIYLITSNWKEATKYCQKAIEISKKNDLRDYSNDLATLGNIYLSQKKYSLANNIFEKAAKINLKVGGTYDRWSIILLMLEAKTGLNNYNEVIKVCNNELKINSKVDYKIMLYNYQAMAYSKLKENKLAKSYIDKVFEIANDSLEFKVNTNEQILIYENAAEIYKKSGLFEKALYYFDKHNKITKDTYEQFNEQKVLQLQAEFNDKEDQVEINKLKIKEQLKSIEAEKQKSKFYFVALILVIISGISFFIVKRNIAVKKRNLILDKHNAAISEKNGLLSNALFEKEILIKEIHHRVKNNLQLVMSLLNIQARKSDHPDVAEFMIKGQNRITSMALVHQNLYQANDLSNVDFKQYLDELIESVTNTYDETIHNVNFKLDVSKLYFDIQTAIPLGLIVNELICNALKHAFPNKQKGEIFISAKKLKENKTQLIFKDNGIGNKNFSENSDSLGIKLISLLTDQIKGKLKSSNNEGLEYKIIF